MARRLLVILGFLLAVSSSAPLARSQEEGQNPPPSAPVPVDPAGQDAIPEDLKLPPAPLVNAADEVGGIGSEKSAADEPRPEPARPKTTKPKARPAKESDPPRELEKGFDDLLKLAQPAGALPAARPRTDPAVVRAQAPGEAVPASPPPPVGASGESSTATVDLLPLGKQSVAVTVDVQAPSTMNLNHEADLKLIVRNTGASDALNVEINDELPEGLECISSNPKMNLTAQSHLSLRIPTLAAGSSKTITVRVKPTKTGPFDHTATVKFETGCRSRTSVLKPLLKVDVVAKPTVGKVLRGQPVQFDVTVSNLGDGPARNVAITARLSTGLRHENGKPSDDPILYELTLPELMPKQSEKLDPLSADAVIGGDQSCTVTVKSPDVDFIKEDAEVTKTISVVEPKLKLTLQGPDSRYTDTVADYQVILENPGTSPTRKIRVVATLPTSARLVKAPPDARFDATTRRLSWTIDQIEPGAKPPVLPFQVRMGGIGDYEFLAEATADSGIKCKTERKHTDVVGMPDVDLVVSESKRVLDVGGMTKFLIRLRNYGTKEATNIQVSAVVSGNLEIQNAGGGSKDVKVSISEPKKDAVKFEQIEKLGPGKEMLLGILVKVVGEDPKLATCRVTVIHDDLTEKFEDMAAVKVTTGRRTASAAQADPPPK